MDASEHNAAPVQQARGPGTWRWLALVGAVAFVGIWAYATANRPADSLPESGLIGQRAPSFDLEVLANGEGRARLTLAELLGRRKLLFVNFWASWCTTCADEAPELERFAREHQDHALVVGIALQDRPADALAFASYYGLSYPLLLDPRGRTGIAYGILGVPETFVVTPEGRVLRRFIGAVTEVQLWEALASWLSEDAEG